MHLHNIMRFKYYDQFRNNNLSATTSSLITYTSFHKWLQTPLPLATPYSISEEALKNNLIFFHVKKVTLYQKNKKKLNVIKYEK